MTKRIFKLFNAIHGFESIERLRKPDSHSYSQENREMNSDISPELDHEKRKKKREEKSYNDLNKTEDSRGHLTARYLLCNRRMVV
jgi:hypothetical protein